jgi:hypothetical protein
MKLITKYYSIEAKPCPCCGGEPVAYPQDYGPTFLTCKKCGLGFSTGSNNDSFACPETKTERIEFLIKKWNKRIKE